MSKHKALTAWSTVDTEQEWQILGRDIESHRGKAGKIFELKKVCKVVVQSVNCLPDSFPDWRDAL
jgi:hypothetical protein